MSVIYIASSFYIVDPFTLTKWLVSSTSDTMMLGDHNTRVKFWEMAFKLFQVKPFGYGLGRAGHVAARFFTPNSRDAVFYSTDGWYLKLLCETGFPGFILYLFFFFTFLFSFTKILFGKVILKLTDKLEFCFFMAVFISINLQNIVSNVLDFSIINYFFWMLMGYSSYQISLNITRK